MQLFFRMFFHTCHQMNHMQAGCQWAWITEVCAFFCVVRIHVRKTDGSDESEYVLLRLAGFSFGLFCLVALWHVSSGFKGNAFSGEVIKFIMELGLHLEVPGFGYSSSCFMGCRLQTLTSGHSSESLSLSRRSSSPCRIAFRSCLDKPSCLVPLLPATGTS